MLIKSALMAVALGLPIACPDTTSPCALSCVTTTCIGSTNCSTNAACTTFCNGSRTCQGVTVDGLFNAAIGPTDFAVQCYGSQSCQGSFFIPKPAVLTRFGCFESQSCFGTNFYCANNNCELLCDGQQQPCFGVNLFCGGSGKSCNVICNGGGCSSAPKFSCSNSQGTPCNITMGGNDPNISPPCPPGQLYCPSGCVNSTVTVCPNQCDLRDPCIKSAGNKCVEVADPGGPYNCTCSAPNYKNGYLNPFTNLLQSCALNGTAAPTTGAPTIPGASRAPTTSGAPTSAPEVEGTSLTLTTYATKNCIGSSSAMTYPVGCGNNLPGAGMFTFSKCTNKNYCQAGPGTGSCGGISLFCNPNIATGVCVDGVIATCGGLGVNSATTMDVGPVVILVLLALF